MNTVLMQVSLNIADKLISLQYLHFLQSLEKGLITKECIVRHTDLNFALKRALHFSKLAIKLLTAVKSCFKP